MAQSHKSLDKDSSLSLRLAPTVEEERVGRRHKERREQASPKLVEMETTTYATTAEQRKPYHLRESPTLTSFPFFNADE